MVLQESAHTNNQLQLSAIPTAERPLTEKSQEQFKVS